MQFALTLFFVTILHCSSLNAQVKSEDDLKKQAEKFFEEEEYNQAYKLYAQLVSLYPKDPEFNYRLGVCMIYTEPDKKKPFSYLQIAVNAPKDAPKDAKFYLAKTYHINYKFDEAIKLYNEYKLTGPAASVKKLQVDREIQACKNGKRLLTNLSDLVVINKKQLNEADYFRSYELKDIGGKLLVKPEDFRTGIDKKKKEKSIIYLPKSGERVYFSSFGDNGNNGRDIYFANRLPNGSWAKAQPMPSTINTEYDEDYPFLHPNGKTLYFSSKGHNSMGGYDVFKTTFNPETQTWSKPENLEFPINSPDDDILFVTDSLEKTAYFSTGRYSPYGKLDVLKINTERRPMNCAILKGTVVKEDVNQSLKSKITVKNMDNGELVGTYQAQDNGDYYMELPNGGQFLFTVETPGIPTQSDKVQIPIAYSLRPFKQVISYDNKVLKIINYFDGQVADDNYAMMIDLIEKKAKLEINENDPYNNNLKDAAIKNNNQNNNANELNAVSTNNPTVVNETGKNPTTNNTNKNVTNEQLLSMAKMDAKEAEDEATKLKQEATDAYGLATQKNEEAIIKQKEADLALTNANAITDVNLKNEGLKKANELKEEANIATNVANTAANLAKKLEMDANQKQKEADLTNQFIKELDAVTKNKNNKEALAKLETIQKELDQMANQPNQSDELVNSIKAETELKQKELEKIESKNNEITNEINLLKNEVKSLETDLANETDNTLKDNITSQIRELNNDIELKNKDFVNNEQKITNIKNQVDGLNQELQLATNILNEKAGTNAVATNNNGNNNKTNNTTENNTNVNNTTNNTNNNNAANNANNNVANNANNNNAATNETNNQNLNYNKLSSDYNSKLNTLKSTEENKDNLLAQNNTLSAYNNELNTLINNDKNELAKTKDAALKTKLNEEIKNAEKQKTENNTVIASNTNKIKQFDSVAINNTNTNAVNTNTASGNETITNENNNATNTNSVAANNNTVTNENISKTSDNGSEIKPLNTNTTNKTELINELNTLKTNLKSNEVLASNNLTNTNYQEISSNSLKQDVNQKFDIVKQNEVALNNLINQIESNVNSNSSNTPENLLNQADELTNKASALRKEATTKTGTEKDALVKQAVENEKLAVSKKLEASTLQLNENKLTFDNNDANLIELQKLTGDKTSNEISQANLLIDEAKLNFKQAQKIKDEANNYPSEAAKLGGLNNAEEKENEALLKQQKALDILTKVNPNYQVKTIEKNDVSSDNITQLNEAINKTSQSQVDAYLALSNANENELKLQNEKLNNNPTFKAGNNTQAQTLKNEADVLTKEALNLITQSNSAKTNSEKANLLLQANNKESEALKKINEANYIVKESSLATNNNNNANNNATNVADNNTNANTNVTENNTNNQNETNNAVTTNTTNTANANRIENNNNNAANSNTTAIVSNTTAANETNATNITNENAVNTNTTAINETNANNVAQNSTLSDDPKKLKADLNNPKENSLSTFDAYTNSEAINLKNQANEKITKALNEDNVLASELDNIPASATNNSGGTITQESITNLQNEAEKLNNDAYALRKTATTKTGAEKDNLIAQAKEMEQQATSKKLEAANNLKQFNIATYEANNQSLADLAKMAEGKNISELNDAVSIMNEINTAIKQANSLRSEANNLTSDAAKLGGYNNAEEKEAWVIAKQENLLNVYKKYFSNYTLKEPNLAVANNSSNPQLNSVKAKLSSNYSQHIDGLTTLTQANEKEYKSRFLALSGNLNATQTNLKTQAQNSYKKSNDLIAKTNQTTDLATKKNLLIEANENGQKAIDLLNQIKTSDAIATNNNANNANNTNNTNNNNVAANNNNNNNTNNNVNNANVTANTNLNNNNTATNNNTNVVKLKVEGLEIKNTNAYTANKPIPIDEKIPDGLVFKVQIGAFKTPLPNNTFKGLSPVIGQTTPNGYIRYMAGNFDKYESANAVKNDLRNLGYNDAFVVVYFNGQRITLAEAVAKLKASGQPADLVSVNNTSAGITTNANVPKNTFVANTNNAANTVDTQPVEVTKELEQMNGLLYTVQIGVFSKQVTRAQLYNLRPIYTEKLPNGLYRYTAGIYNQSSKLLEDKRKVVDLGVKDAFVSAYYNAKRIPFAEGQKIQTENNNLKMETENPIIFSGALNTTQVNNTNTAVTNAPTTNVVTNPTVTPFTNNVTTGPTPTADNGVKTDDAGISYKVQIGAYMNQVPNEVAAKFSNIKTWPVQNSVINGLYIYTIGNFNALSFAKQLRDEAVSLGITDAFITVYKDGKKLYGAAATEYLSK